MLPYGNKLVIHYKNKLIKNDLFLKVKNRFKNKN